MPAFQFTLESVLKLREQKRDECRRLLAFALSRFRQAESQAQQIASEQADLRNYLKELSQGGTVAVGMVSRCHMHLAQLERRFQQALLAIQEAQREAEAARQRLVEADQQVKALEKLRENRREDFEQEAGRRERLEQDDVQSAHRHRKPHS